MPPSDMVITANWSSGSKVAAGLGVTSDIRDGVGRGMAGDEPVLHSSLVIEPGASLSVDSLFNFHEAGAAAIVLESLGPDDAVGSLIHLNEGVEATVQRYIGRRGDESAVHSWHMIASPVREMDIRPGFVPEGVIPGWIDFYRWDESLVQADDGGVPVTGWWVNSKLPGGAWNEAFDDQFLGGRGYLLAYGQPGKEYGERAHAFAGVVETEGIAITGLTHSPEGEYAGWHLLGNPFASGIDWNKGDWQRENILGGPKIWDAQYGSYTPVIDVIPAMNGFMVHTSGNGALHIPPGARVHYGGGWYKSDAGSEVNGSACDNDNAPRQLISLLAVDTEALTAQKTIILFRDDASEGYDPLIDTPFKAGYAPAFYSVAQVTDSGQEHGAPLRLSLNNLPEARGGIAIPLGFEATHSGMFRVDLLQAAGGISLFLEDLADRRMHALSEERPYVFPAYPGDTPERFLLHLTDGVAPEPSWGLPPSGGGRIVARNDAFGVYPPCASCTLLVFDVQGSLRLQEPLNGDQMQEIPHFLPPGVYVARLQCLSSSLAEKVMVTSFR